MIKMNLQFFGGRGSAGGNNSGSNSSEYLSSSVISKKLDEIYENGMDVGDKIVLDEDDAVYKGKVTITKVDEDAYKVKGFDVVANRNVTTTLYGDEFDGWIADLEEDGVNLKSFDFIRKKK